MRTKLVSLAPLFRSRTQAELLGAIYLRPTQSWTLASLARELDFAPSTLHAEIRRLEQAELITVTEIGRSRVLTPNLDHPIAEPLMEILQYAFGPRAVVAEEFSTIPGAERVLIFGSWAARQLGQAGPVPQDIDVLVVGDAERSAVYAAADRAQERLGLPVNPVLVSLRRWVDAADALIRQIRANPVIDLSPKSTGERSEAVG